MISIHFTRHLFLYNNIILQIKEKLTTIGLSWFIFKLLFHDIFIFIS